MNDLLLFIVQNLVTNPDAVSVDEQNEEGNVNLLLTVDPKDMGLIIGKSGQTIRAIRKLMTVRAIAENVRINLQLVEPQGVYQKNEDKSDESSPEDKPSAEN